MIGTDQNFAYMKVDANQNVSDPLKILIPE